MTSKIEKNLDRPKRVPMAQARQVLNVDDIPENKVARWVLDTKNRLQVFQKAGWEFVIDKNIKVGDDKIDGTKAAGNIVSKVGNSDGQLLYLMVIDREYYDEDQAEKAKRIDMIEEELHANVNKPGHYGKLDLSRK